MILPRCWKCSSIRPPNLFGRAPLEAVSQAFAPAPDKDQRTDPRRITSGRNAGPRGAGSSSLSSIWLFPIPKTADLGQSNCRNSASTPLNGRHAGRRDLNLKVSESEWPIMQKADPRASFFGEQRTPADGQARSLGQLSRNSISPSVETRISDILVRDLASEGRRSHNLLYCGKSGSAIEYLALSSSILWRVSPNIPMK